MPIAHRPRLMLAAPLALLAFLAAAACGGGTSTADMPPAQEDMAQVMFMIDLGGGDMTPPPLPGDMTMAGPTTHDVAVGQGGNVFAPASLTIKAGDSVKWTWASSFHNVVSGTNGTPDNKFCNDNNTNCANAPLKNAGESYTFKFNTAGAYPYFCSPHESSGMKGTITVQ